MNRAAFLLLAVVLAATGVWLWRGAGSDVSSAQGAERIVLGQKLYAENCASCHGANLEGQPDWKSRKTNGRLPAPPHDASGHTWHHSDEQLFAITKFVSFSICRFPFNYANRTSTISACCPSS